MASIHGTSQNTVSTLGPFLLFFCPATWWSAFLSCDVISSLIFVRFLFLHTHAQPSAHCRCRCSRRKCPQILPRLRLPRTLPKNTSCQVYLCHAISHFPVVIVTCLHSRHTHVYIHTQKQLHRAFQHVSNSFCSITLSWPHGSLIHCIVEVEGDIPDVLAEFRLLERAGVGFGRVGKQAYGCVCVYVYLCVCVYVCDYWHRVMRSHWACFGIRVW